VVVVDDRTGNVDDVGEEGIAEQKRLRTVADHRSDVLREMVLPKRRVQLFWLWFEPCF
jgi:hypothetical protein